MTVVPQQPIIKIIHIIVQNAREFHLCHLSSIADFDVAHVRFFARNDAVADQPSILYLQKHQGSTWISA